MRFQIEYLSKQYEVRKLTDSDVAAVYALCRENPQSEHFWLKNGFERTGVEAPNDGYVVVIMEKKLYL